MAFKATIEADVLRDALGPISALVDECKWRLGESGLSITAVDAANVGMCDLTLSKRAFDQFDADEGVLGIPLERVEEVLGMADGDDLVAMELDAETRKLHIDIDGLEYTLALIDPDSIRKEPDIPELDLPGTYVFESSELDRAVRAADLCSDHVEIEGVADAELVFAAQGDTDDVEVTLGTEDLLSGTLEQAAASLFSLDYLSDMAGPMPSDAEVSLLLGDEMPVKLRYSLADGAVDVVNMLAPRIQSE